MHLNPSKPRVQDYTIGKRHANIHLLSKKKALLNINLLFINKKIDKIKRKSLPGQEHPSETKFKA